MSYADLQASGNVIAQSDKKSVLIDAERHSVCQKRGPSRVVLLVAFTLLQISLPDSATSYRGEGDGGKELE